MSDADERFEFDGVAPRREYGVVAIAVACVAAAVLATALIPAAASVGLGDAPAESLIPLPAGAENRSGGGSGPPGSGASDFGALNVGNSTSVGGPIGEGGESPYRSQDTEVHFRVRSQESNYWRTGAFDTYTGSGWSRSGPSDATAPVRGEETRYRVELVQSASAAPTVWRPTDLERAEGVSLTEGGLARADDPGFAREREQVAHVFDVLIPQRIVETEFLLQPRDVRRVRVLTQSRCDRIQRPHPEHDEQKCHHREQNRDREQEALEEVPPAAHTISPADCLYHGVPCIRII